MLRLLVQIKLFIKIHCINQLIMKVCSFIYKLQRLSLSVTQVPSIKSVRSWFQFTFPKHPQKWGLCVSGTTLKLINQWLVLKLHCLTNDLKQIFFVVVMIQLKYLFASSHVYPKTNFKVKEEQHVQKIKKRIQRSIKLDWIFYQLLNLKGLIKIFLLLKYLLRLEDTFIFLTLFRILLYLQFYDDLLMLKAAAKFRNFSFSMWLVFCLFLYLLKPQSLVLNFLLCSLCPSIGPHCTCYFL